MKLLSKVSKSTFKNCPLCGKKYDSTNWSISRRDNETEICSSCGLNEALQDYAEHLRKHGETDVLL